MSGFARGASSLSFNHLKDEGEGNRKSVATFLLELDFDIVRLFVDLFVCLPRSKNDENVTSQYLSKRVRYL